MTVPDIVIALAVSGPLGAIAWHDLNRFEIPPDAVAALIAGGLLLHDTGASGWWQGLAGAAFGMGAFLLPVTGAILLGRRWPMLPGDAGLLGGLGWVLGPLGFAWALVIGAPLAILHRFCLQRRRGRRFMAGYTPLGPGLAAGALLVFLAMHSDAAPGDTASAPLDSTQFGPDVEAGPPGAEEIAITLHQHEPVSLVDLAARIASRSGLRVAIEERPARSEGGGTVLRPAEPQALVFEGRLHNLLDRVAAASGYRWAWRGSDIVFFRYWDVEWPGEVTAGEALERVWEIDRTLHDGLRSVLGAWASRAGWSLDWKAGHDYRLGADARFSGGFLDAVDAVLADPATRRALVATAFEANRHLVIEEAR